MKSIEEVLEIAIKKVNTDNVDFEVSKESLNKVLEILKNHPLDSAAHNKTRLQKIASLIKADAGITE
tara:strand:- start:281 stop:481 length:201 start_codon:yes stop_codon:yes gene_type:complete